MKNYLRRGLSLVEIMVIVALFGILMTLIAKATVTISKQTKQALALEAQSRTENHLLEKVRQQVWSAPSLPIEISDANDLKIEWLPSATNPKAARLYLDDKTFLLPNRQTLLNDAKGAQ